jgi:AcrR family transcriptional regulator
MVQGNAEGRRRSTRRRPGAEKLLGAASELFYRESIGAVGVDTVSEKAGVSKRTLYNRFGGKDALVAEYLRRRDERWRAHLRDATEGLDDATDKLLAVFESYGEWLVGDDFRGCAFANAAAEMPGGTRRGSGSTWPPPRGTRGSTSPAPWRSGC